MVTWPFRYSLILFLSALLLNLFLSPLNYSLKLLWAPLVDSFYHSNFGRRKSWLIPVQYLIGICLFILSYNIDSILSPPPSSETESISSGVMKESRAPRVYLLAVIFFVINFLCATQDVAVDGWALTMLSKRNVVYGSTCNTVGQTVGFTLGYLVFPALESPEVCNRYFRSIPQPEGMVTLAGELKNIHFVIFLSINQSKFLGFLFFWSMVFLITTTLVCLLKSESVPSKSE